jgi:hypothetical protein
MENLFGLIVLIVIGIGSAIANSIAEKNKKKQAEENRRRLEGLGGPQPAPPPRERIRSPLSPGPPPPVSRRAEAQPPDWNAKPDRFEKPERSRRAKPAADGWGAPPPIPVPSAPPPVVPGWGAPPAPKAPEPADEEFVADWAFDEVPDFTTPEPAETLDELDRLAAAAKAVSPAAADDSPAASAFDAPRAARRVGLVSPRDLLGLSRKELARGVVLAELLGPPLALRRRDDSGPSTTA